MRNLIQAIVIFLGVGVGLWLLSFAVENLRATPKEHDQLTWARDADILHATLDDINVRYIKVGTGPNLVLFHTLRTQLDIFYKLIPGLQEHFTVYAVDYPGHGWSDIPKTEYRPDQFYGWAETFLDKINVQNATVAGISIGGTIVLELAARQNPRITKVISINPFDYRESYSAGLKGSSFLARVMFTATDVPFVGETFMRLRNPFVERKLFEGGVVDPASLSDELFTEFSSVGGRPWHYRGFINLLRNIDRWQEARNNYAKIKIPVLVIYGEQDWAPKPEREQTRSLIPGVVTETIGKGGHFLSLDQPKELQQLIVGFAGGAPAL